jgi:hypothetical protein
MAGRRAGRSGPLPAASATGGTSEVHGRYTAHGNGAARHSFSSPARLTRNPDPRKFWSLRVPRKGARTGFIKCQRSRQQRGGQALMPDSFPCPPGSGAAGILGSATPPEPGACPSPALAGRTGLPLSIWPGVPGPGCPAPGPDHLPCPGAGAVPVLAAFSRPGDLVAVPGAGCPALASAAARTGRRIADIADPGGQPGGASCPPGQAALAVAAFSATLSADGAATCQTALYPACHRVLRPGGILAIIAARTAPGQIPDLAHAVASARTAGLIYAQHIVLLHAALDGGQLRPFPGQDAVSCPAGGPPGARIHADLLVLTK